jgi:hypothetical protein
MENISEAYSKSTRYLFKKRPWDKPLFYVLVSSLIYFVRAHTYILHPQLYAEDGFEWIATAYNKGFSSVFSPLNGFFHFPERLFGWLYVSILPLRFAPFIFNLTGMLIFSIMTYYIFTTRTKILSNTYQRIFMLLCLGLLANAHEFFFNFSNSIFFLGIIGVLILTAKPSKNKKIDGLEKFIFALSCFTLPFSWFYLPIVLIDRYKFKAKNLYYLSFSILGTIAQLATYFHAHAARSSVTIKALLSKYTLFEIYNQMIMPAIRFARLDESFNSNIHGHYATIIVTWAFILVMASSLYVFWKSNKQVRYLLYFFAIMTIASLKSPILASNNPISVVKVMATVTGGNRYFIFGIIGINIVSAKLTNIALKIRAQYVFLVAYFSFGLITSYHNKSLIINKHLVDYRGQYSQAITQLDKGKNQAEYIPENPTGFYILLNAK